MWGLELRALSTSNRMSNYRFLFAGLGMKDSATRAFPVPICKLQLRCYDAMMERFQWHHCPDIANIRAGSVQALLVQLESHKISLELIFLKHISLIIIVGISIMLS